MPDFYHNKNRRDGDVMSLRKFAAVLVLSCVACLGARAEDKVLKVG